MKSSYRLISKKYHKGKGLRVLVVSDIVNNSFYSSQVKDLAGNVDAIISCGDLPVYYLDYLASSLLKPLFYVCGNHDHYNDPDAGDNLSVGAKVSRHYAFGGTNLDSRVEKINSVIFAGLEGSILYNYGEHQYTERQMQRKILGLAPALYFNKLTTGRFLDVLVAHSPPRGIHDGNDTAHMGFKAFLKFIRRYRPKYLLHGHTHIYDVNYKRIFEYEGTKVINCYNFAILDIKP